MFNKKKTEVQTDFDIFVMFDSKTESYDMPMYAMNEHDMVREIMNAFSDPQAQAKSKYYLNAEDYSLFRVGAYSKKLGKFFVQEAEHIANCHDLRATVQKTRPNVTWKNPSQDELGIVPT